VLERSKKVAESYEITSSRNFPGCCLTRFDCHRR